MRLQSIQTLWKRREHFLPEPAQGKTYVPCVGSIPNKETAQRHRRGAKRQQQSTTGMVSTHTAPGRRRIDSTNASHNSSASSSLVKDSWLVL